MAQPDSPLETFWRMTIMLGTLVVGGMAFYVYGPPPEQAAEIIDDLAARAKELCVAVQGSAEQPQLPSPPPAAVGGYAPARPMLAAPALPGALTTVTATAPGEPQLDQLKSQLVGLGAEELDLKPWGNDGVLHRFQCSVALAGGAGFRRHVEAIGASPAEAMAMALVELRSIRN